MNYEYTKWEVIMSRKLTFSIRIETQFMASRYHRARAYIINHFSHLFFAYPHARADAIYRVSK